MNHSDTINILFERQAARTPDNRAVNDITYLTLNTRANRMAHRLISRGVGPGAFVGITADHSPGMIAAILAVIKSGGAYVAVEPDFPRERIAFIFAQTGAKTVFTERKYAGLLPDDVECLFIDDDPDTFPDHNPQPAITGSDALYVLYTSGTTGTPKGVVVEHRNVANYVRAFNEEFRLDESDRMLQCSVCTFDIFVEELYPVLMRGGALVTASREERCDVRLLAALMEREGVTVVSGFPYLLQELDRMPLPSALRLAISGGDVLRGEYVGNIVKKIPVYNTYGPSETTVCATYYHYTGTPTPGGSVPIGRAVAGVSVRLLGEDLSPVEPGRPGEICISGAGVARGYLARPEETAAAFVTLDGKRTYLTGDMGVELPDGNIDFTGRKDRQVMIWGKRVEPSEVESVMSGMEGIRRAAVKLLDDNILAGWYVADRAVSDSLWRGYLGRYLPDYMIPRRFIRLGAMPLTANGKTDPGSLFDYRRADAGDSIDALVQLRIRVLREVFSLPADHDTSSIERESAAYYAGALADGSHVAFTAYDGDKVAGCGGVCFYRVMPSVHNRSGLCARIMNMYTGKEYRRRGIASEIVRLLIHEASSRGAEEITLETTDSGREIYRRLGFTEQKDEMVLKLKQGVLA